MDLIKLVEYGTPAVLLGILYYLAKLSEIIKSINGNITEIKAGMVWSNECGIRHTEIDRRLDKLEEGV